MKRTGVELADFYHALATRRGRLRRRWTARFPERKRGRREDYTLRPSARSPSSSKTVSRELIATVSVEGVEHCSLGREAKVSIWKGRVSMLLYDEIQEEMAAANSSLESTERRASMWSWMRRSLIRRLLVTI